MNKKRIAVLGGAVVVIALGFTAYYLLRPVTPDYQAVAAQKTTIVGTVSAHGTISSAQNVDLSFDRGGRVASVYIKVGDKVKAGDRLVALENSIEAAQLAGAEAALNQRQAGATSEQVAVYQAAVNAAKAALQQTPDGGSLILTQAEDNEITSLQQSLPVLDSGLSTADNIVAVDNFNANENIRTYLGSRDKNTLNIAMEQYTVAKVTLEDFRSKLSTVSRSNVGTVASAGTKAFTEISNLLTDVSDVLNATTPVGPLAEPNLTTLKSGVQTMRGTVNAQMATLQSKIQANDTAATTLAQKQAAYDQALATLKSATDPVRAVDLAPLQAAAASALANFNKTILRSPVTGVVSRIDAKVGGVVSPNIALASVVNPDNYQIETYVSETDVSRLKVGDTAEVTVDAFGSSAIFSVTVSSVDQSATAQGYKLVLVFAQPDPRLKAGMNANVTVKTGEAKDIIAVPASSVIQKNGKYYVLMKNGEQREVTVGMKGRDLWEIKSGINEGENVFSFGQ